MERNAFWAALMVVAAGLIGCSSSASSTPEATETAEAPAGPDQSVYEFLQAVRQGDDTKAQGMLTTLAQKKTTEMDMVVAPPGSDTAKFEVGASEISGDGTARVASVWSDLDHEGKRRTDQITWVLKQENSHWRIAGMATKIFPDQGPVMLNFENPQEMLDTQRQAEEAATRRAADEQQLQATKPQDPFQTERQ